MRRQFFQLKIKIVAVNENKNPIHNYGLIKNCRPGKNTEKAVRLMPQY